MRSLITYKTVECVLYPQHYEQPRYKDVDVDKRIVSSMLLYRTTMWSPDPIWIGMWVHRLIPSRALYFHLLAKSENTKGPRKVRLEAIS